MAKPREYPEGTHAVSVPEAARMLGVSERTMNARVADGSVRAFRLGKLVRISRKELERIMEGNGNERNRETG